MFFGLIFLQKIWETFSSKFFFVLGLGSEIAPGSSTFHHYDGVQFFLLWTRNTLFVKNWFHISLVWLWLVFVSANDLKFLILLQFCRASCYLWKKSFSFPGSFLRNWIENILVRYFKNFHLAWLFGWLYRLIIFSICNSNSLSESFGNHTWLLTHI